MRQILSDSHDNLRHVIADSCSLDFHTLSSDVGSGAAVTTHSSAADVASFLSNNIS